MGSAEIAEEVAASTTDVEHREFLSIRQGALGNSFEELDIRVLEPSPVFVVIVTLVVRLESGRLLQNAETMRTVRTAMNESFGMLGHEISGAVTDRTRSDHGMRAFRRLHRY